MVKRICPPLYIATRININQMATLMTDRLMIGVNNKEITQSVAISELRNTEKHFFIARVCHIFSPTLNTAEPLFDTLL